MINSVPLQVTTMLFITGVPGYHNALNCYKMCMAPQYQCTKPCRLVLDEALRVLCRQCFSKILYTFQVLLRDGLRKVRAKSFRCNKFAARSRRGAVSLVRLDINEILLLVGSSRYEYPVDPESFTVQPMWRELALGFASITNRSCFCQGVSIPWATDQQHVIRARERSSSYK